MKTNILLPFLLLPILIFSQDWFTNYEDNTNVFSSSVDKQMLKMMTNLDVKSTDKETIDYKSLIENLENYKTLQTKNDTLGKEIFSSVDAYIKTKELKDLASKNDANKNIKYFVKPTDKEQVVSELIIFYKGLIDNSMQYKVVKLEGNIDLNKLYSLTQKLHISN